MKLIEQADIDALIAQFTEQERAVYNELMQLRRTVTANHIKLEYQHAQFWHKLYKDTKRRITLYGEKFVERLAIVAGYKSETPVYEMIRVVEEWDTWEKLYEEVVAKLGDGTTWKKLVYLARQDSDDTRVELIQEMASGRTLENIRTSRKSPRSSPGRNPKVPETLDDLLVAIERYCGQLARRAQHWLEFPVANTCRAIQGTETATVSAEYSHKVGEACTQLEACITDLQLVLDDLHAAKRSFTGEPNPDE